jgi:AcrR family transcriptional regulator
VRVPGHAKVRDMDHASNHSGPELRADAAHNRERILAAAREAFAATGMDASMTGIARRAGLGVATVFRRFPTKESLLAEVFGERIDDCSSVIEEALADPDPWRGFCSVIEKVCAMQAADHGFTDAFLATYPHAADIEDMRSGAVRGFTEVTRRAQAAGRLRTDFVPGDLILILTANGGVTAPSADAAPAASRRLVAYLLDAFRADPADQVTPLPPPPPLGLHDVVHTSRSRPNYGK